MTAYSKRHDLVLDLNEVMHQLGRAQADDGNGRASVRSVPRRTRRPQALQDRLSDDDQRVILERFEAGVPQQQLAGEDGISLRSVGRLLRKWRAERDVTQPKWSPPEARRGLTPWLGMWAGLVQELECVRYRSQAQSSASWGLPANVSVGRMESV